MLKKLLYHLNFVLPNKPTFTIIECLSLILELLQSFKICEIADIYLVSPKNVRDIRLIFKV